MTLEEIYSRFLECGSLTTDSRKIGGGELFVALKGENFDGNAYALKALADGAAYAIVNAGSEAAASGNPAVIAVEDTLETLKALARHHRRHCLGEGRMLPLIGLTGTNGKTTTKELLRAVLSAKYKVTATEGNLNNDIGVPLSLLKISHDTELAIIEMGANHPDDIKHLVEVCEPDAGLITNVGKAHLLGFGSFEGVKKAKGQLYDYLDAHAGTAFVNMDQPDLVSMASERHSMKKIPYGLGLSGAVLLPLDADHPYVRISVGGKEIRTHLVGAYNAMNVMAALAVGDYFGVDRDAAIKAIEAYQPSNNRSQMSRTASNVLILDAYNANPSSMAAALDNFALIEAPRKVALLGDMRELGADSLSEHISVVRKLSDLGIEAFLVGEEFAKALESEGVPSCILGSFKTSEELALALNASPLKGATVLVKGSRGIQMEKVVPVL